LRKLEIQPIDLLSTNNRGATYTLSGGTVEGYLLAFRTKGSVSGNHWHEGKSKGKNPERLILVSGSFKLDVTDLDTGEEASHALVAPVEVKIYPRLLHTLTALEDSAFLECNSLEEHKADTYYPDVPQQ
jgi:hypothetical protein